jgi:hypothetical protein
VPLQRAAVLRQRVDGPHHAAQLRQQRKNRFRFEPERLKRLQRPFASAVLLACSLLFSPKVQGAGLALVPLQGRTHLTSCFAPSSLQVCSKHLQAQANERLSLKRLRTGTRSWNSLHYLLMYKAGSGMQKTVPRRKKGQHRRREQTECTCSNLLDVLSESSEQKHILSALEKTSTFCDYFLINRLHYRLHFGRTRPPEQTLIK